MSNFGNPPLSKIGEHSAVPMSIVSKSKTYHTNMSNVGIPPLIKIGEHSAAPIVVWIVSKRKKIRTGLEYVEFLKMFVVCFDKI
jgi:hypothetical protein